MLTTLLFIHNFLSVFKHIFFWFPSKTWALHTCHFSSYCHIWNKTCWSCFQLLCCTYLKQNLSEVFPFAFVYHYFPLNVFCIALWILWMRYMNKFLFLVQISKGAFGVKYFDIIMLWKTKLKVFRNKLNIEQEENSPWFMSLHSEEKKEVINATCDEGKPKTK